MTHTFHHRFKGGITATVTYEIDDLCTTAHRDRVKLVRCEWSEKPTMRILREYVRWNHSVFEQLANLSGAKIMDVIQTGRGPLGWEAWVYEPGKPAKKIDDFMKPK